MDTCKSSQTPDRPCLSSKNTDEQILVSGLAQKLNLPESQESQDVLDAARCIMTFKEPLSDDESVQPSTRDNLSDKQIDHPPEVHFYQPQHPPNYFHRYEQKPPNFYHPQSHVPQYQPYQQYPLEPVGYYQPQRYYPEPLYNDSSRYRNQYFDRRQHEYQEQRMYPRYY